MRIIETTQCVPGMVLARNIYNDSGLVLLSEGMELTPAIIHRLLQYGVHTLHIHDERTADIVAKEPIPEEMRIHAIKEIRTHFKRIMHDIIRKQGDSYLRLGKDFKELLTSIVDELANEETVMVMVTDMCITDNYLYNHSLNVCLYSTLLGMSMGLSRDELMVLGLGAILHDIGKIHIPQKILLKPGPLTEQEFEMMKRHTEIGFTLLKDLPNIPLIAAHCAFQHHERLDGSGYPRGIDGDEIHTYAKIIGICDVYDALTTNRSYRKANLPHEAMEFLYGAGSKFEKELIELFFQKVAIYPLGMTVKLNTGETGVVVDLNTSLLHRPVIRVLEDEQSIPLQQPYEIDLSKQLTVMIDQVHVESQEIPIKPSSF